jgi:hypothetical protein
MKLCLMVLSVPWYMLNGIEDTANLSHFLTFITGSSSRVSTMQNIGFRPKLGNTYYYIMNTLFNCFESLASTLYRFYYGRRDSSCK